MDWKLELVAVPITDVAPHCRLVGGQVVGDLLELGQRGTQVFDDLGCQDA